MSFKWESYESLMEVFEAKDENGFVVDFSPAVDMSLAPILFWTPKEQPYGFLGNWYPAEITVDGVKYMCTEQYIMAQKALLFNDLETYTKIMSTSDPKKQKKLGRSVAPFDLEVWLKYYKGILFKCCLNKFMQHKDMGMKLLETGCAPIAEASPLDATYGIGIDEHHADAKDPYKWHLHGKSKFLIKFNLYYIQFQLFYLFIDNLGQCLMEVRSYLRKGYWNEDGIFVRK